MALEIRRKQRENAQAMMRRFQKAVQQSGILLEKRRRQFAKRAKSDNMQKRSALRKIETKKKSLKLFEELRRAQIPTGEAFDRDSLKSQLRVADKYGARYALLLGQKEALENTVILRDMESGKQEVLNFDAAVAEVKKRLRK